MSVERHINAFLRRPALAKTGAFNSKAHLEFVRGLPSCVSGLPAEDAHHLLRKRNGLNDYLVVPLTHTEHMELHTGGEDTFEDKHCVDLRDAVISALICRIMELEGGRGRKK